MNNYGSRKSSSGGSWLGILALVAVMIFGPTLGRRSEQNKRDKEYEQTTVEEQTNETTEETTVNETEEVTEKEEEEFSRLKYTGEAIVQEGPSGLIIGEEAQLELSELDEKERPGVARATLTPDMMKETKEIVALEEEPVGFNNMQYEDEYGDKYWVYTKSYLIDYIFWKDEINLLENNLTGTQELSQKHKKDYEELVRQQLSSGATVEYEVIPNYKGEELVARSITMKMLSSNGMLDRTVTIYNKQEGVNINYLTGKTAQGEQKETEEELTNQNE